MDDARAYRLSGPADPQFSRVARLAISGIASAANADIEEVDDVRLVVSELVNIALDSQAKAIELLISTESQSLSFELRAVDVESEVTNDLSLRIFDALVSHLNKQMDSNTLSISGTMAFAE